MRLVVVLFGGKKYPHQLVLRQFVDFLYVRQFHFIWVTNLFCGSERQTDGGGRGTEP